jgi:YD repeat-containing protein
MTMSRRRKAIVILVAVSIFAAGASKIETASAANGSVVYTYDTLGRLTMVSYDTGVCIRYTYDPAGNRLSETTIVSAPGSTGVWGCFNWGQALWGQ